MGSKRSKAKGERGDWFIGVIRLNKLISGRIKCNRLGEAGTLGW
jgi:hypothetical protein